VTSPSLLRAPSSSRHGLPGLIRDSLALRCNPGGTVRRIATGLLRIRLFTERDVRPRGLTSPVISLVISLGDLRHRIAVRAVSETPRWPSMSMNPWRNDLVVASITGAPVGIDGPT